MTDGDEIAVRIGEVPPCARCGGTALLRVRFGHSWTNTTGHLVEGFREAELCPACDSSDPPADALPALLAVAEEPPLSRIVGIGGHVGTWVDSVRHRRVDLVRPRGEEHAHRRLGELPWHRAVTVIRRAGEL